MSIKLFEKEQYLVPYLSDAINHNPGLDQLGLNLTGERIFDLLLPGLNNVTKRIRYYSFYSWFFDWYAEEITDLTQFSQIKYLRRAEFLVALISACKYSEGIPGITKALEVFQKEGTVIELEKGTQEALGETEGSYWKYSTGIFGQYYAASLRTIGLIRPQGAEEGVYIRTAYAIDERISGVMLANAFRQNIGAKIERDFIEIVKNGSVSKKKLHTLSEPFNMIQIPENTEENKLLLNLLIGPDRVTAKENEYYRRDTIKGILENIGTSKNSTYDELQFPWEVYNTIKEIKFEENSSSPLWYVFFMEQLWSVSCTGALYHFLEILYDKVGNGWAAEDELVDGITKRVYTALIKGKSTKESTFKNYPVTEINEMELAQSIFKQKDSIEAIADVILLVHKTFFKNHHLQNDILTFGNKYSLFTRSSFSVVMTDVDSKSNYQLEEFIKYFLTKYVVYRHHFVSLRKMTERHSTSKFVREDGYIKFIDTFRYGFSSPRTNTLVNFLNNLNLTDMEDMSLSSKGVNFLKSLDNAK